MAVNRYDTPAQLQFINTYVPIPFEQLYTLGKEANARVDKALEDFGKSMDKFGDFRSRSNKDMQTWYDETIGKQMPYIDQMAKNPDLIKDRAFRAQMQASINNVDRALLSKLKQNAAQFDEYKKMEQQLALAGKGNPLWHNRDFSNYDSTIQPLFDETPIPYMDINELSKPYMDQLKPGYIKTEGVYDYFGNTKEDLNAVANAHLTDMINTPQGQMHLKMYMQANPNATTNDAIEWFRNAIVDSNIDRTLRPKREMNDMYKLQLQAALTAAKKGKSGKGGNSNSTPVLFSTKVASTLYYDKLGSKDDSQVDKARRWFASNSSEHDRYVNNKDINGKETTRAVNAREYVTNLFEPIGGDSQFINAAELDASSSIKGVDGKHIYSADGVIGMMTLEQFMNAKMGITAENSNWDETRIKIEEDLISGNIPGVAIIPTDKVLIENSFPGQESFTQEYRLMIPTEYFEELMPDTFEGFWGGDYKGEDLLNDKKFRAFISTLNGKIANGDGIISNQPSVRMEKDGSFSAGANTVYNKRYVEIPVVKGVLTNEQTRSRANTEEFKYTNMGTSANRDYREENEDLIYAR